MEQTYVQTIKVTNNLGATVEGTLRPGASERYSISPSSIVLKPGKSIDIDVHLKVLKFAQRKKAEQQGIRDIFHIKVCGRNA